ncbi:DUF2946 family protein [Zavarzinia sp. CC-PAN008]|uniref:DUF2946 family protein n=1 Tax=Zavarzinia sp. CC-PAN008 TaxID=3243332 RepID=UPI003F745D12
MARRWAAQVALLFVVLRILVPPGFMPDLAALQDGRLQVVLCSADGARTLTLAADGSVIPDEGDHPVEAGALHCPFGLAGAVDVILPALPVLQLVHPRAQVRAAAGHVLVLRPPVRGPPLGARAPPHLLV